MTARLPGDDIVLASRLRREAEAAVRRRDAERNLGLDRQQEAA